MLEVSFGILLCRNIVRDVLANSIGGVILNIAAPEILFVLIDCLRVIGQVLFDKLVGQFGKLVDAVNGNCECSGLAGQIRTVRVLFRESNIYCYLVPGMRADQLLLECVDERL